MSDAEIVVGVRGDISGGKVVKQTLDEIATAGNKATGATDALERQMKSMNGAANMLKTTLGGLFAAIGVRTIVKMIDDFTLLQERLKQATRNTMEFKEAFAGLQRASNETGGKLKDAVDVFQRLSFVRDELKATVGDMVLFTGTVQKLGVISGASLEEMSNGLRQLGQAMSAGVVRAEEFNSVMENTPVIAKTIADQFGVTTGQLRQLVVQGKVASEDMFNALLNAAAGVEEAYSKMPMTIGRAFGMLTNELQSFIGQTSEASGATKGMIAVVDLLRITVNGLKVGFDGITTVIATTFNILTKAVETSINFIADKINWLIDKANMIPGVNLPKFGKADLTGGAGAADIINAGKEQFDGIIAGGVNNGPRTIFDPKLDATPGGATRALTKDYAALAAALSNANSETKAIESKLKSLVDSTRTWQEQIQELERLRPFAKTQAQLTAIDRAIEKIRTDTEKKGPLFKAFEAFASGIDDGFKKAFAEGFTGGAGGFKKMLEGMKSSFMSFLSDLIYTAAARPILLNIVAGVGGSMGLSSGSIASVTGGGGAGGLGGLGSIGSGISGLSSLFGNSSGLASAFNGVGNFFGGGSSSFTPGFGWIDWSSNLSGASTLTNGAFGGTLGGSLGGFGGNMLANAIFGGDRGMGSSIGGMIGGIAGSFIPVPILGPMIGSFLGNAIGGLFGGGKPSAKAQWGALDLADMKTFNIGGATGAKYSKQNAQMRDQTLTQAQTFAQALMDNGATLTGSIYTNISDTLGYGVGTVADANGKMPDRKDPNTHFFKRNDAEGFTEQLYKTIYGQASGLSGTIKTIVDKLGFDDLEKLTEGLNFGQIYDGLIKSLEIVDPLKLAIDALNKQFDEFRKQATDLGLPLDKLNEAYEKQKSALEGSIKAQQAGFDSLTSMTKAFKNFLDGQALGSSSSLSPMGKLELAQGNFGTLLAKAQGGDASVTPDLLTAGNELINIGRSVYASSVSFAGIESFVRGSISSLARQLGVPGFASGTDFAPGGLAMVGERGPELRHVGRGSRIWSAGDTAGIMALSGNLATDVARTNAQVVALLRELLDEAREQKKETRHMRKNTERAASKAAVAGS